MTGDDRGLAIDPTRGGGSVARSSSPIRTGLLDAPERPTGEVADRILAAALTLVARWGLGKTTLADIAREAGCSRATLYRVFPGGKQELFLALGRAELASYFASLVACIERADTLEDALTDVIVEASQGLTGHEALQYVLEREPDIVLPFLGFHQVDRLYAAASATLGPALERFLPDTAAWAVEWAGRAVLSYAFNPSPLVDLRREADARDLVRRFYLPALQPQPVLAAHS
jgi:AcrR family transcriptional regulator